MWSQKWSYFFTTDFITSLEMLFLFINLSVLRSWIEPLLKFHMQGVNDSNLPYKL